MSELIACHHKVTLDIAKRDVCTIEVVNRDTANILEVNVCENGKEVSLENATLVTITYSNDTVDEMQISEDFKTASVRINANCLKRGINFAQVCIYSGDNGLITAEMLTINCKQKVGSDNPAVPDPDMPKLKEMIEDAVAQAGGGAGLEPLVGTTQTITPSQVLAAIKEGRDVALQYEDSYYGTFVFGAFNATEKLGIVVSNSILPQMDGLTGTLMGFVEDNTWIFKATKTATKDDVGTAVNEALTAAKASGEFDGADGITPTIGDNGNWFLGDTDTGKPSRGDDGKSAYSYAQDGGYTGTEVEFAAKLAAEGLDKALYVVNITENDDGTFSADKTFEEIVQAYKDGKYHIIAAAVSFFGEEFAGYFYEINEINPAYVGFIASYLSSSLGDINVEVLEIRANNTIRTAHTQLAQKTDKLPNPYPLTFTGAVNETYDGSSAKTIEIPSGGGGGGSELTLLADINFDGNTAQGFEYTDLNDVSEIYIVGAEIKSGLDKSQSSFSLKINDIEISANAVLNIQKASETDTKNSYYIAKFNGVFWELLRSPNHGGANPVAHTNSPFYPNSVVLDVGKANKLYLYVVNPSYKPVAGWMKIWVR